MTLVIVLLGILSLRFLGVGPKDIGWDTIIQSFVNYNPENGQELIIRTLRFPRLLMDFVCGISFAVSGALMQGVTNNPMASPSIMGINAGAAFGLAIAMILIPTAGLNLMILCAFAGAGLSTLMIWFLSMKKHAISPVYLALAGTAVNAAFMAITQALVVYFDVAQELSFWTAGGIGGVREEQVSLIWPWTLLGFLLAMSIAKSVTLLGFGEELAIGLGGKIYRTRFLAQLAVLILSGSAVAVAGPIGFIGLVVPHMARKLVGVDYRKVIPFSALLGSVLTVVADMAARTFAPPFEIPLGAVTALVGVPFFLYVANRKQVRS